MIFLSQVILFQAALLLPLEPMDILTHRYCWEINVGKSKIKLCTSVFTKEKKYLRHRDFSGVKDFNSIASQTVNILL